MGATRSHIAGHRGRSRMGEKVTEKRPRKARVAADPGGFGPAETAGDLPPSLAALAAAVEGDGGGVLARYREPCGGTGVLPAPPPLAKVGPTPFHPDPCPAPLKRLSHVIWKSDRFLAPLYEV